MSKWENITSLGKNLEAKAKLFLEIEQTLKKAKDDLVRVVNMYNKKKEELKSLKH